jgi:hypothetical protein
MKLPIPKQYQSGNTGLFDALDSGYLISVPERLVTKHFLKLFLMQVLISLTPVKIMIMGTMKG